MANYAYLRVSTHTQDVENQKLSVLDYCNSQGIAPIEFVEDTTSGRRSWRDQEIGRLLETADAGDVLVAAEVSRLLAFYYPLSPNLAMILAPKSLELHAVLTKFDIAATNEINNLIAWKSGQFLIARSPDQLIRYKLKSYTQPPFPLSFLPDTR